MMFLPPAVVVSSVLGPCFSIALDLLMYIVNLRMPLIVLKSLPVIMMIMIIIFVTPRPRCGVAVRLSRCMYIGIVNTCSKWNGGMSGALSSGVLCRGVVVWVV